MEDQRETLTIPHRNIFKGNRRFFWPRGSKLLGGRCGGRRRLIVNLKEEGGEKNEIYDEEKVSR